MNVGTFRFYGQNFSSTNQTLVPGWVVASARSISKLFVGVTPATSANQTIPCNLLRSVDNGVTYAIIATVTIAVSSRANNVTFGPVALAAGNWLQLSATVTGANFANAGLTATAT